MKAQKWVLPFVVVFTCWTLSSENLRAEEQGLFVQAVQAALRSEPKMTASRIAELKRGDMVTSVKKQGGWIEVTYKNHIGWISTLMVGPRKPVGHAELMKNVSTDEVKESRRRTSSLAVAASTRGLAASERVRHGREAYRTDYLALKKLEEQTLSPDQIEKFLKDAQLGAFSSQGR